MNNITFEWHHTKAATNLQKHGVSFDVAKTVFYDESAMVIPDTAHASEERFIILGMSADLKLLVVCHCYREEDSVIRIISARKATQNESKQYRR